jgi:hypothetical protein
MQLQQIEDLLLQEMEDVVGGTAGVCECVSAAHQSSGTGQCVCESVAEQKLVDTGLKPPTCSCKSSAAQLTGT